MTKIKTIIYFLHLIIGFYGGVALLPILQNKSLSQPSHFIVHTNKETNEYTGIVGKVDDIAKKITVRIVTRDNLSHGSGVIIAQERDTYYVATAKHVVKDKQQYQIVTPNGVEHKLDLATIETSDAYDLAIFSFQSDKNYQVASLGKYRVGANNNQFVFVSGFPKLNGKQPERIITGGIVRIQEETKFTTKDSYSITKQEQGLLYSNLSYGGMSGGAVLDRDGRLIGIHTGVEAELYEVREDYKNLNLGYSLGVSIQDALSFFYQSQLDISTLSLSSNFPKEVSKTDWEDIESQLFTATEPSNDEIIQLMNYGNQLWRYGRYEEAIQAFQQVIELDPDFDKAYYGMGLTYYAQGRQSKETKPYYQQAVIALEKAAKVNPSPYYYWRCLGKFYWANNQYDLALIAYDKAIEKNSTDFVLYIERGDILSSLKQYPKALESYQSGIDQNTNHSWGYYNLAVTYHELNQYNQALSNYDHAIEINSNFAVAYNNRGTIHDSLKQYYKAIADYDRAIEIDPNSLDARLNRGNTYTNLKQYKKAIADYDHVIEIKSNNTNAYINRGKVYLDLAQYDRAINDFDKAISINNRLALGYNNRGTAYYDLKQYQNAMGDLNQAIKIDPKYSEAYNNLGNVHAALKQNQQAISSYKKAIKLNSKNAEAHNNLGFTYYNLEQYQNAIANYDQAVKIDPQYALAYYNRGTSYASMKQHNKAIADFNLAVELNPKLVKGYYSRGISYDNLKQSQNAIVSYTAAIEIDPEYFLAYYNRGYIYRQQKQYHKAIADLDQSIEIEPNFAPAYIERGFAHYDLGKISETRQDWNRAASLYQQQNQPQQYEVIREALNKLPKEP